MGTKGKVSMALMFLIVAGSGFFLRDPTRFAAMEAMLIVMLWFCYLLLRVLVRNIPLSRHA